MVHQEILGAVDKFREGRNGEKCYGLPSILRTTTKCIRFITAKSGLLWFIPLKNCSKQATWMNSLLSGVSPSHSNMFLRSLACLLGGVAGQGEWWRAGSRQLLLLHQAVSSKLLVWKELSTNATKTSTYLSVDMLSVRYTKLTRRHLASQSADI